VRSPFSRRTDYAIRAAVEIARHDGVRVKRHPIAAAIDAPTTVVAQALADLVRGEIVLAAAGRTGGYVLSRPAHQLTVADVVAAVEVDPEPRCVLEERGCADAAPCALHATLYEAQDAFTEHLATQSLASLAGLAEPAQRPAPRTRRPRSTRPAPQPPPVAEPVATGPRPSLGGWLD
jgi:Rrf2 family protein